MPKLKLLIINYLFPPAGGITVQRAVSLAKYLPGHNFEVHVLSAGNAATPVKDPQLLRHVPAHVRVHRSFTPELPFAMQQKLWGMIGGGKPAAAPQPQAPARPAWKSKAADTVKKLLCPDPQVVWVPFALRKARQIVRRYGIDAVLVTVPPFSTLLVGNALKREFPHLALISDFRDEWLTFYLKDFDFQGSDYNRRRSEIIERQTIECSDLVTAVTATSRDEIRRRYPDQPDRKFVCVQNGYDPEVFGAFTPRRHGAGKIVVTHMGTVYKTASPRFYLDALNGMPAEIRSRVETRFVGRISHDERPQLEGRDIAVRLLGFMSQADALHVAEETDYLLLTMTDYQSLPGKLFEYLAMRKPILALSPAHGEVARVMQETAAGWCVDPHDPAAIQGMIAAACERVSHPDWFRPNLESIRRFERPRLAEEYAAHIHECVAELRKSAR